MSDSTARSNAPLPGFGEVAGSPWADKTTFIVGGGPSLRGFDFRRLGGLGYLLGVNQAMFDMPVDAGVSMDFTFIRRNVERLCAFSVERSLYLAVGRVNRALPDIPGATYLHTESFEGLSFYTDTVRLGCTSGYTALNVAVLKHTRRIVLLGFDYGLIGKQHHYHDAYSWHRPEDQSWEKWALRFNAAALDCAKLGVEVVNACPGSAITAFPIMTIEEALAWGSSQHC